MRVILAPDARGPLPPPVNLPSGQLPASVAASAVSLTPVPMPPTTSNGTVTNAGLAASSANGVASLANTAAVPSNAIPLLSNTAAGRSGGGPASVSSGGNSSGGSSRILPNNPPTPNGLRLTSIAQAQLGARYTWAGTSPSTGFDCSGFVYYVFNTYGYPLPRTLEDQMAAGRRVRLEDLRAGDIVFFADTYTAGLSHDGVYLGNGQFIHAVDESTGVAITPLNSSYWEQRFVGAVRVIDQ